MSLGRIRLSPKTVWCVFDQERCVGDVGLFYAATLVLLHYCFSLVLWSFEKLFIEVKNCLRKLFTLKGWITYLVSIFLPFNQTIILPRLICVLDIQKNAFFKTKNAENRHPW